MPIDADAIAKKYGGVVAEDPVDAIAKKYGGSVQAPSDQVQKQSFLQQIQEPQQPEEEPGYFSQVGTRIKSLASNMADAWKRGDLPAMTGLSGLKQQYEGSAKIPWSQPTKKLIEMIPFFGPSLNRAPEASAAGHPKEAAAILTTDVLLPALLPEAGGALRRLVRKGVGEPIVRALGGTEARMAETPPGGPAISTGTRGEVAQLAADKGIDLLPGQATEAWQLQAIQHVGERSLAGERLQKHVEGQKATLTEQVKNFQEQMAPAEKFPGREAIGGYYKEQTNLKMEMLKKSAEDKFKQWTAQTGDIPIDTTPVQAKFDARLKEMDTALENTPPSYAKPIREILETASKFGTREKVGVPADTIKWLGEDVKLASLGPNAREAISPSLPAKIVTAIRPRVSVSAAGQMRSAFWEVAHDFRGNIPERVNAIASEIVQDLDGVMAEAAKKAGTLDTWRSANADWKRLQETYNTASSPLYKVLKETDPSKVPEKLLSKGYIGGSPRDVQVAKAAGLDLNPAKNHVIQDIAEHGFSLGTHGGNRMGEWSHEFLKELFEPAEIKQLYMMGRIARTMGWKLNPSETSAGMAVLEEIRQLLEHASQVTEIKPKAALLRGPLATKFSLSPTVREIATGIRPRLVDQVRQQGGSARTRAAAVAAANSQDQNRILSQDQNRILREIIRK